MVCAEVRGSIGGAADGVDKRDVATLLRKIYYPVKTQVQQTGTQADGTQATITVDKIEYKVGFQTTAFDRLRARRAGLFDPRDVPPRNEPAARGPQHDYGPPAVSQTARVEWGRVE